jgi:hypothetical protein
MSGHTPGHALRPWVLSVAILALIAGPILLYKLLPLAGLSAAAAAGVVAIVAIKHLGVIAVLLAPIYALLRRRSRR